MPHYDYRCKACGHEHEVFQRISAEPLKKCPQCGKSQLERLLGSGGGLLFKGSGFYLTDYREGGSSEAKRESPSEKKSEPKGGDETPS